MFCRRAADLGSSSCLFRRKLRSVKPKEVVEGEGGGFLIRIFKGLLLCGLLGVCADRGMANPTFASAVTNGIVNIPGLDEASGVVASHNNAGVLWTHNDSGNAAVIF